MTNRTPTLGEVVEGHIEVGALHALRVAQPGLVDSYDDETGFADVVPQLKRPVYGEDGEVTWLALPKLYGVPVLMLAGGGYRVKSPVKQGDVVLLIFCDFDIGGWKAKEGATDTHGVVQPGSLGAHQVADAVAIVGLRNPLGAAPAVAIEVQDDGKVLLGAGASQGIGLGHALRTELDAIWSAIYGGHVHPVVGVQAGAATIASGQAAGTPSKQTVESAIVKTAT